MTSKIMALIWKEMLAVLRDKKVRISILVPPVIQLCVFTFAATLDVKNVSIGILNRDHGEQGIELCQRFTGATVFSHIHYLKSVEEIAPFIDNQKGAMVVSLDSQFSRNLDANKTATVQLILDGRKSNATQIITGYATSIINQFNMDLSAKKHARTPKAKIVSRIWFNPNTLYFWYNIPCLVAVLSMVTCLVVTSQAIARERELGTFDQLIVSPLTPFEILIGKITPGIVIGMLEGLLLVAVGVFILQVPFTGSFLLFFHSLFVFVCSISGVGLFISSLCTTQQQAMLGTFIFMVPSTLLSGFATPIENMPAVLQPFTAILPLTYMLILSKGIFLKAMPAHIIWSHLWQMVVISAFTIYGANQLFRRRLE
jgi:ABC-2 type transport system permease protein